MDGATVRDRIESQREVELARLGSDRRLVALTDAQMDERRILREAATTEAAAAKTFSMWAASESHPDAAKQFEVVAATERNHRDRVLAELTDESFDPPDRGDGIHAELRELTDVHARVGAGLIARPLIGMQSLLQFVNFFINEADQQRADLFRDLRGETVDQLDQGVTLLDEVCSTDSEFAVAVEAGVKAIDATYQSYAESLEAMGVDPKPVC